jgi:hypothetical protein
VPIRFALPLVVTMAAVGLGVFAPGAATASCVGPSLEVPGAPTHTPSPTPSDYQGRPTVVLTAGTAVTVTGEWYFVGCNDTSSSSGCSRTPDPPPEKPARDVRLILVQNKHTWPLGTADASGLAHHYRVRWQVTLPADLRPGDATLIARGRVELPVTVVD